MNKKYPEQTSSTSAPLFKIWSLFTSPSKQITESGARIQAQLFAAITLVYFVTNLMGLVGGLSANALSTNSLLSIGYLIVSTLIAYILSRTKHFKWGVNIFVLALTISAITSEVASSGSDFAPLYSILPTVFIIGIVLMSLRSMILISLVSTVLVALLPALKPSIPSNLGIGSAGATFVFGLLSIILLTSRNRIERERLNQTVEANRILEKTNTELEIIRGHLEERVSERTKELREANSENFKNANQFKAITEVVKAITATQNLQVLLPQVTDIISEQFDVYHVAIYFNDPNNQFTLLSATNSPGGKKMMTRGHRIKVGDNGIIGYVSSSGRPRIALDVGVDAVFFNEPDLPGTRSEIGLPLKSGEKTIGVLNVQSTQPAAFSGKDIDILSTLADQVTLAIENTRLFEQTQKALTEAESISRQYLGQTWGNFSQDKKSLGFRYASGGVVAIQPNDSKPEPAEDDPTKQSQVVVPIQLRGTTIGSLKIAIPQSGRVKQNQMDLINAVAERVALAAENARLFEETSQRAEREKIISEIAGKIGATFRTENILSTTAKELSQFLEGAEILINLNASDHKKE